MKQTIGDCVFRRIRDMGVGHILAVQSEVYIEFMQLEDWEQKSLIGGHRPLNRSCAAECYAKLVGWATIVVRPLRAARSINCAYAEHIPGICICGGQYGSC
jgi:TPP-dependent 2-oxoacid decarboxylase